MSSIVLCFEKSFFSLDHSFIHDRDYFLLKISSVWLLLRTSWLYCASLDWKKILKFEDLFALLEEAVNESLVSNFHPNIQTIKTIHNVLFKKSLFLSCELVVLKMWTYFLITLRWKVIEKTLWKISHNVGDVQRFVDIGTFLFCATMPLTI